MLIVGMWARQVDQTQENDTYSKEPCHIGHGYIVHVLMN